MYAIIDEGGRQYKVTSGDMLLLDREATPDTKSITFDRILFIGGEGQPKIGAPLIAGATVTADVIGPEKGKKVDIIKYKRRKGFHKHIGHRQNYLRVKVTGINV